MMRLLKKEIVEWQQAFIRYAPGRFGTLLRHVYWNSKFLGFGDHIYIGTEVLIQGPGNIEVGDFAVFGRNIYLAANDDGYLKIGDNASLNSNVWAM